MRAFRWSLVLVVVLVVGIGLLRFVRQTKVEAGSVLVLELSGAYVEAPEPPWISRLIGRERHSFMSLLSELRKAERDDRLAAVILHIRDLDIGWAKAQEIRDAVDALRDAGRRPIAYLEVESFGSNLQYYLASAAEELYVAPGSRVSVVGLAAQFLFLGGLWEKLGVEVEVERIGEYKSAAESLAGREMSEPHREMANALLDSIDAQFVRGIAEGRHLSDREVRRAVGLAPSVAAELEELGLIDGARSLNGILAALGDPTVVRQDAYARVESSSVGFEPVATFALIHGAGSVVTGRASRSRSGEPLLASGRIVEALDQAAEDPSIDAIVFRIDSPGGSALASDLVWEATRRARERKPLVASFSDVAASGGYYVACGADSVVADAATLTGSIGVFVLRPVLGGLLEKLEIGYEGLTRGPRAEILLSARRLSEETRTWLQDDVREVYDRFVARVAEGRGLAPTAVDAIGRGRVWTGQQALELGLVDAVGGLRVAAMRAKQQLGLDPTADVALAPYPPRRPLLEELRETLRGVGAQAWASPWPEELRRLASWLETVPVRSPALIPPLLIEIH
jgi:protease-4